MLPLTGELSGAGAYVIAARYVAALMRCCYARGDVNMRGKERARCCQHIKSAAIMMIERYTLAENIDAALLRALRAQAMMDEYILLMLRHLLPAFCRFALRHASLYAADARCCCADEEHDAIRYMAPGVTPP